MEFENIVQLNAIAALERAELYDNPREGFRKPRIDALTTLNDGEFIKNFRLSKDCFEQLVLELDPFIAAPSRASAIPKERKILSTLNLLGTGSFQNDIGNSFLIGLSTYKVSDEVVEAINNPRVFNNWVKFPNRIEELNTLRTNFYQKYDIPGVVGCIDCTHVAIHPPPKNDHRFPEHIYVNRKGYHSINSQLICDYDLRILNVNAKFPGSSNDKHIWNQSSVSQYCTTLHERNVNGYYLLGDSGYALRPWLMTPFRDPQPGTPDERYNATHRRCRCLIEQCNGVLKSRWRCLCRERTLHYDPLFSSKIVNACCVLHNMCIQYRVEPPREGYNEILFNNMDYNARDVHVQRVNPLLAEAQQIQQNVVRNYF